MRVALSYSVEIEEVPNQVAILLEKTISQVKNAALEHLDDAARSLSLKHRSVDEIARAAQNLDSAKIMLERVDLALADYVNILQGYVGVAVEAARQESIPQPEPPTVSLSPEPAVPVSEDETEEVSK
tara:strand:- start:2329 stop:2709 length:381 start_codon:yes stop_codon:yes gene_type:complete